MITVNLVNSLIKLDKEVGVFKWIEKQSGKSKDGLIAGTKKKNGAIAISIKSKEYLAHNISWLVHYGEFSEYRLLHIDGNRANNKIENLMEYKPIRHNNEFIKRLGDIKKIVSYDSKTGNFEFICKSISGSIYEAIHGYIVICIFGKKIYAHRLAYLLVTGNMPKADIDHINGNKKDNRWINLRDVSRSINAQNKRPIQINNKSAGLLGVYLHKGTGRYCASIKKNGVKKHIGLFDTPEQAHAAYVAEKRILHEGCTI